MQYIHVEWMMLQFYVTDLFAPNPLIYLSDYIHSLLPANSLIISNVQSIWLGYHQQ
jgi:hypothetical protein